MINRLNSSNANFIDLLKKHICISENNSKKIQESVTKIIKDVSKSGDTAIKKYTNQFDGYDIEKYGIKISKEEILESINKCEKKVMLAFELAARRISSYQKKLIPKELSYTDKMSITLGCKWTPVDSCGLYIPGGKATYPSSVLMTAIPAKIAGVKRIVMTVPTPSGYIDPMLLLAASLSGVNEIYRVGGAQAIAAMAYGTESIKQVDKIVGPGNSYVAEAKRQVFGQVGIDSIAGPSELLLIADKKNNPHWIALDLLSQAEHDEEARVIFITDNYFAQFFSLHSSHYCMN